MSNNIEADGEYKSMLECYQKTDLTLLDKKNLKAFDKDIADKLIDSTLFELSKKMLQWELSAEFVKGAKFSLYKFSKHFKA